MMTMLLDQAIARLRDLPAEDQDRLAIALLSLIGDTRDVAFLDDETRIAVEDGLAQARLGEFVSDEEVAKAEARWGLDKP
jgi:predicted transcriptional regulator